MLVNDQKGRKESSESRRVKKAQNHDPQKKLSGKKGARDYIKSIHIT